MLSSCSGAVPLGEEPSIFHKSQTRRASGRTGRTSAAPGAPAPSGSPNRTQTQICTQGQSTNTHADVNAVRYTLQHSTLCRAGLGNIRFDVPRLDPRSRPKRFKRSWKWLRSQRLPFIFRPPPPLPFGCWLWPRRADMFRMHHGNGLIKNAKQLAITAPGPNGH